MAFFSQGDPSSLLGDEKLIEDSYSLSPWPWDHTNTPFTLQDSLTDIVLNPGSAEWDRPTYEKLFLNRLASLWQGSLALSIELSEEDMEAIEDDIFFHKEVSNILNYCLDIPVNRIIWSLHASSHRTDYKTFETFINQVWSDTRNREKDKISFAYSIGREEAPLEFLVDKADDIIIRSYDFSGRHSTLENAEESIENSIKRKKIPYQKLILALPLYGRKFRSSDPDYWINKLPYKDIVKAYTPEPDSNEEDSYYFNGPKMARQKTILAREKGLKGVALYPYEWDSIGVYSLKEAIASLKE
jgi:hypothetical protein